MEMVTLNLSLILNLASAIASAEVRTSTKSLEPHTLDCSFGKIFLHSACYSETDGCDDDDQLPNSEMEQLYRKCANGELCNFQTETKQQSVIRYACEGSDLHSVSDMIEEGLKTKSRRILFYYDGEEYKNTGRGLNCTLSSEAQMIVYRNWIQIPNTSRTLLEMVVSGQNETYSAGMSIYRDITRRVDGPITLRLLPDPNQHDQISLGFTASEDLDVNCSSFETSGAESVTIIIIVCVVCVAVIAVIIGTVCIMYRRRKKFMAGREQRGVQLTKAVSEANNYSEMYKENNKERELNNYDYATLEDRPAVQVDQQKPQNTFSNTVSNDVINSRVSRDGKKIINMKQLESRVKSSGYSEPRDALKPIKISSKASDYAEPCNEKECFTSKCLQNKTMLQNYDHFHDDNNPKSWDNAYSHVGGNNTEDDYDHFDRTKGKNSRLPDGNYSHIPRNKVEEDDYNTTSHFTLEDSTPNPNYDHIGRN